MIIILFSILIDIVIMMISWLFYFNILDDFSFFDTVATGPVSWCFSLPAVTAGATWSTSLDRFFLAAWWCRKNRTVFFLQKKTVLGTRNGPKKLVEFYSVVFFFPQFFRVWWVDWYHFGVVFSWNGERGFAKVPLVTLPMNHHSVEWTNVTPWGNRTRTVWLVLWQKSRKSGSPKQYATNKSGFPPHSFFKFAFPFRSLKSIGTRLLCCHLRWPKGAPAYRRRWSVFVFLRRKKLQVKRMYIIYCIYKSISTTWPISKLATDLAQVRSGFINWMTMSSLDPRDFW